ncbi:hypothetical protein, partial [Chitinophaga sp.]|uniref:hypothetical protein n=1 Tax=Chitinophaga sp. TaxID=1869181 RepID=UPI00262FD09C
LQRKRPPFAGGPLYFLSVWISKNEPPNSGTRKSKSRKSIQKYAVASDNVFALFDRTKVKQDFIFSNREDKI